VLHAVPWKETLLLMAANVCWVVAYDTFYAMTDRADDLKIGVKSSAIWFGKFDRLITALLQLATLFLLVWAGEARSACYFVGVGVAAALALHQQWMVRHREPARSFAAFLANHYFGAAVFLGIAVDALVS
ncbi:MAG: UbiA family prenyltransferase, partial [Panacagrimonas sp.]